MQIFWGGVIWIYVILFFRFHFELSFTYKKVSLSNVLTKVGKKQVHQVFAIIKVEIKKSSYNCENTTFEHFSSH